MKVLITGGGTGGHVYPGLAILQALLSHEVAYAGSPSGLEKNVLKRYPIPFYPIHSGKLAGKNLPQKTMGLFLTALGFLQSLRLLCRMKPDVVIGTGGYVSSPVLLASCLLRTPTLILEQNLLPGKTTRFFSRFVSRVLVSFEESKAYLPNAAVKFTGNLIRPEIGAISKEEGCRRLGLSCEKIVITVMGGSQGARAINRALLEALPLLREKPWQIVHLTGKAGFQEVERESKKLLPQGALVYRPVPFCEEMEAVYGASDLIVSRAGATSLAEIRAAGKPSILIPYPYAAENHQELNARWLEKQGRCLVVLEDQLSPELLAQSLEKLIGNPELRKKMSEKTSQSAQRDALASILKAVQEVTGRTL